MSGNTSDHGRISIAILAIGGQGGGVLADWLVDLAEHAGWLVQTTSVPGVAQRTGATVYYAELFPRARAEAAGRAPVLALMPTSGDVDIVIAAELMEAGRAMQRGLVTPDRTTLIVSSHRSYAILEKSALGDGIADPDKVHAAARAMARRYLCFDMAAIAEASGSVISAALFGALAGAQVLPFERGQFEDAIRRGGVGVEASLNAFAAAFRCAAAPGSDRAAAGAQSAEQSAAIARSVKAPGFARDPAVNALLERTQRDFPAAVRPVLVEGVRKLIDCLDPDYALDYLRRMERIAALDEKASGAAADWRLTGETARYLALWMGYEDTIRVADLKTRASRFEQLRKEVRAQPGQIVGMTEFLHPRVEEVADTLPAGLGQWLLATPWARRFVSRRLARGRFVRTGTLSGFLLLWSIARLRRFKRSTLRYRTEMAQIGVWLARIESIGSRDYAFACEVAACARVLKGYSETYERGRRSFSSLMAAAERLEGRSGAADALRRLRAAALEDEDGCALTAAKRALSLE